MFILNIHNKYSGVTKHFLIKNNKNLYELSHILYLSDFGLIISKPLEFNLKSFIKLLDKREIIEVWYTKQHSNDMHLNIKVAKQFKKHLFRPPNIEKEDVVIKKSASKDYFQDGHITNSIVSNLQDNFFHTHGSNHEHHEYGNKEFKNRNFSYNDLLNSYKEYDVNKQDTQAMQYLFHVLNNKDAYTSNNHDLISEKNKEFMNDMQTKTQLQSKNDPIGAHPGSDLLDLKDYQKMIIENPDMITNALKNQRDLHDTIKNKFPENIDMVNGKPHITLTRNIDGEERTPLSGVESYADSSMKFFGSNALHYKIPLDDVWHSYNHSHDINSENDTENEFLVHGKHQGIETKEDDLKQVLPVCYGSNNPYGKMMYSIGKGHDVDQSLLNEIHEDLNNGGKHFKQYSWNGVGEGTKNLMNHLNEQFSKNNMEEHLHAGISNMIMKDDDVSVHTLHSMNLNSLDKDKFSKHLNDRLKTDNEQSDNIRSNITKLSQKGKIPKEIHDSINNTNMGDKNEN